MRLTCFVFYGDLQGQKIDQKNAKNVNFDQWIRMIQSGALTLYRHIFNDYLWSYDWIWYCSMRFDLNCFLWWSSRSQIGQKMPNMATLVLESKLYDLVP